jgi:hypothetical protein
LQKSLSQPELRSAPSLSGKVVLPQCRPWTKPLSAQPRRAKGSKKRTGTVGITGTIGIVGIVGTAVGDQHGLSLAARLCSRAFFKSARTHSRKTGGTNERQPIVPKRFT